MKDVRNILLLWFDASIKRLLQKALPLKGYTVTAIRDPIKALNAASS